MQARVVQVSEHGGPGNLRLADVVLSAPGAGEVLLRQQAIGLNYIDVYHRNGLYPLALPFVPGVSAAGVVEAVGAGVRDVQRGDRVAYAGGAPGGYASHRIMAADRLLPLPESVDTALAAAVMLQGLTAQYLLRSTYRVTAGDTVLIHAAAGGVGLLLCQWAKALGARVLGTVSSAEKATLVQQHGCDEAILYTQEDFALRVAELTAQRGVQVVYDSIGKDTFMGSLQCLAPRGMMVSFGNASGPVPAFDPLLLSKMGSLFLTRPTLAHYTATRADLLAAAAEFFAAIEAGVLRPRVHQQYALVDVAQAHADLEARRTTGSTVLIP